MTGFESLRAMLRGDGCVDRLGKEKAAEGETLGFLLEFTGPVCPETVEHRLHLLIHPHRARVEHLFDAPTQGSHLLVTLPPAAWSNLAMCEIFRIAYGLGDEFGTLACEPDFPWSLEAAVHRNSTRSSPLCSQVARAIARLDERRIAVAAPEAGGLPNAAVEAALEQALRKHVILLRDCGSGNSCEELADAWLAHHGRSRLEELARMRKIPLGSLFNAALDAAGTAGEPEGGAMPGFRERLLSVRPEGIRTSRHEFPVTRHGKLPPRRHEELPPLRLAEERKNDGRTYHRNPVVERSTG